MGLGVVGQQLSSLALPKGLTGGIVAQTRELRECLGANADVSIYDVKWEVGEKAEQNVTRMSGFSFW